MCTWNKRHPELFRQLPGKRPVKPYTVKGDTVKGEESRNNSGEKTSVERQLEFLHHLHV